MLPSPGLKTQNSCCRRRLIAFRQQKLVLIASKGKHTQATSRRTSCKRAMLSPCTKLRTGQLLIHQIEWSGSDQNCRPFSLVPKVNNYNRPLNTMKSPTHQRLPKPSANKLKSYCVFIIRRPASQLSDYPSCYCLSNQKKKSSFHHRRPPPKISQLYLPSVEVKRCSSLLQLFSSFESKVV